MASEGEDEKMPIPSLPASAIALPRVTIQFCTQCKWMLRATYYAQELLSTFALAIGEVALQPSSGGTFIVTIHHSVPGPVRAPGLPPPPPAATSAVLWDRKVDGGFPETKELKRRVRDVIEPGKNLGHVDRDHGKPQGKVEGGVGGGGGSGNSQMDWQQRVAQGTDGNATIRAEGAAETKPPCDDCR